MGNSNIYKTEFFIGSVLSYTDTHNPFSTKIPKNSQE